MAKLKVTAFKKSGKYYTEEVYNLPNYPSMWRLPNNTTLEELRNLQINFFIDLWDSIKDGGEDWLCPVGKFEGYYFIFDPILSDDEQGFMTFLLDRTEEE